MKRQEHERGGEAADDQVTSKVLCFVLANSEFRVPPLRHLGCLTRRPSDWTLEEQRRKERGPPLEVV